MKTVKVTECASKLAFVHAIFVVCNLKSTMHLKEAKNLADSLIIGNKSVGTLALNGNPVNEEQWNNIVLLANKNSAHLIYMEV